MAKSSRPLITFHTSEDESFLIGTKVQLLEFANQIIDAVETADDGNFWNEEVRVKHLSEGILDSKGDVCLDEIVITKTNDVKDKIFYKIYNA